MHNRMAWRPYANLIDGQLDNRVPGKVTGRVRFFRNGKQHLRVVFDLTGDFHEDIRGRKIRLSNARAPAKVRRLRNSPDHRLWQVVADLALQWRYDIA